MSKEIESFPELVELLDLAAIHYYGISVEINEGEDAPSEPTPPEVDVDARWGARVRVEDRELGARLRGEFNVPIGRVVVDVAAEYSAPEDFSAPRDVIFQYVNDVAVMQLLPFVRETVLSLTTKVFPEPILLPVLQRGAIHFDPDETESIPVIDAD